MRAFIRMSMMREREAISEHLDDFFGLVIDSHILETFQNATSGYIARNGLDYVIDPVTYKFSLGSIEDCTSKRWYDRLVENYYMEDLVQFNGGIDPEALKDSDRARKFVKDVLDYEERRVPFLSGEEVAFLSLFEEGIPEVKAPYCLIPPYFVIESRNILDLNVSLVEEALDLVDSRLFAYISLSNDLLYEKDIVDEVVSKYSDLGVDGYFIWVTDFDEVKERQFSLKQFKYLLSSLKSGAEDKEVINMFGGFFSVILASYLIDGVVHGVGISEHKNPLLAGGPAPTRYYVPTLHRMLSLERAQDLLESRSLRCDCPVCQHTSPSDMSVNQLMQHFLNVRFAEKSRVESMSPNEIIELLRRGHSRVVSSSPNPVISRQRRAYAIHLLEWIASLRR